MLSQYLYVYIIELFIFIYIYDIDIFIFVLCFLHRFPRLGLACHGILQAGFFGVFKKAPGARKASVSDIQGVLKGLGQSDPQDPNLAVVETNSTTESPFTFPDVPVARVQGIRAAKCEDWLARESTLCELLSAIVTTEPIFRLSTWLLQQQEERLWLSNDPTKRPIVNLVTPRFSPVVKAISSLIDMLVSPFDDHKGPLMFLDGFLVQGK